MPIGSMRVSKADGSQALDPRRDALLSRSDPSPQRRQLGRNFVPPIRRALPRAGVDVRHLYEDHASGKRDDRPGLEACLEAVRPGDTPVAWKLDRLGRDLRHLVDLVHELTGRGAGLRVLAGEGAHLDTTTANGRLVFGIFASGETLVSPALAEFERAPIVERTIAQRSVRGAAGREAAGGAGLASARARGRRGGRPYKMTAAKLRLAQAAMARRETEGGESCAELGITHRMLYRHVAADGRLGPDGARLLGRKGKGARAATGEAGPARVSA